MSTKLLPYVNSKTISNIPDIQILEASSDYYEYSNLPNILLPGYDIKDWFDNHSSGESIILIDAGNYCYIDAYKDNTNQMHINIHYNNVLIGSFFQNVGEYPWIYLGVGVDDTNQLGYAVVLYRQGDDSNTKLRAYGICQSTSAQGNLYSLLRGAVPIPNNLSGGAGSGYIGNSLLSNKKMVGFNVPTSSAESTKTESVNEASENPVSGKPKIGNGFARIKFLRAVTDFVLIDSYNNYYSPIVDLSNTGWKDGNQTTRWQYLQDGTFESYDDSQAQTKCVFNTKMKKGSAVNLCIECTTENIAAYPDFGFGLMSTMPTEWGYPSGGNRGTVLKWLYDFASTTKGTYKMPLDDISADAEFYLCFYNNSTENIVYKVWFEGTPTLVN